MKKFLTSCLLTLVPVLASEAYAGSFNTLKFTSDSGKIYSVATGNLEIAVNGDHLSFSNTDLSIPLASLVSMEFADWDDSPVSVDAVIPESDGEVTVYGLSGVYVNTFRSYTEAMNSLEQGAFLLKGHDGTTLKVIVNK